MPGGASKDAAVAWILPGGAVCACTAEPLTDMATRTLTSTSHAGCSFNRIVVLFDMAALPSCQMPFLLFYISPPSSPFPGKANLLPQPRSQASDRASPPYFL